MEATKCDKCGEYGPRPSVAVDGIIVDMGKILMIKRKNDPFKGKWALPGGFVEKGESLQDAVVREIKEETGLDVFVTGMAGVFSDPDRDPRGVISVVYLLDMVVGSKLKAGDDAAEAKFFDVNDLTDVAFDHREIITRSTTVKRGWSDER